LRVAVRLLLAAAGRLLNNTNVSAESDAEEEGTANCGLAASAQDKRGFS
jgi:hypothetical protein